jgi:hypothetical protein
LGDDGLDRATDCRVAVKIAPLRATFHSVSRTEAERIHRAASQMTPIDSVLWSQ